jgi:pyruvate/2-oxoglutarate dehydrogenase complex dihydrolipoamide acyltransferase (E2) component
MPQMGVSVAEGTILEWRKRPGDWVEADETLCDVTTDKVDVEIPSPAEGRVERILAEAGETVAVGAVIAELGREGRNGSAAGPVAGDADEVDRSAFHSPVVRRIAEKHGIDLDSLAGTGVGGRVRKKDVLAHVDSPAEPLLHSESPYQAEPAGKGSRREPMSPMREAIARHMLESRRTSAHCTTIVEADMGGVAARRAELREAMERRGVRLTHLAFVAHATVEALQEFPILNASIEDGQIAYHDDVNLGIAVALDDGLIVPVIPRAQRLSLEGIAAAIGDVAERARSKGLDPDDVHGGTFTITNPGQFGAVLATPIINQPQVAILDLEAIVKRPVVVEGPQSDSISIRPMTYLCMSWDHRALDGAMAARFLASVRGRLESWEEQS